VKNKYDFYPFNYAGLLLQRDNKAVVRPYDGQPPERQAEADRASAIVGGSFMKHLCGYVVIHKRKVPKAWHGCYDADALQYLNIHGGLTYCSVEGNYVVFGFDCAHSGDEQNQKLQDPEYVMQLTEVMEQQLMDYAKVVQQWRRFNVKKRAKILDDIRGSAEIKSEYGFGLLIETLCGMPTLKGEK